MGWNSLGLILREGWCVLGRSWSGSSTDAALWFVSISALPNLTRSLPGVRGVEKKLLYTVRRDISAGVKK